jgi:hypothetical protein
MSFPRLALALTAAFGLPLLAGACSAPVAATAASYGADGATVVGTGKSATDHFASMVSKKDCALWRIFKNEAICHEQEGDPNPYHVNYDEPWRDTSNGVPEYSSPLRVPANAPATSWNASVYSQPSQETAKTSADKPAAAPAVTPPAVTAEATPPAPVPQAAPAKPKKKHADGRSAAKKKAKPKAEPAKTPSPDPAATAL